MRIEIPGAGAVGTRYVDFGQRRPRAGLECIGNPSDRAGEHAIRQFRHAHNSLDAGRHVERRVLRDVRTDANTPSSCMISNMKVPLVALPCTNAPTSTLRWVMTPSQSNCAARRTAGFKRPCNPIAVGSEPTGARHLFGLRDGASERRLAVDRFAGIRCCQNEGAVSGTLTAIVTTSIRSSRSIAKGSENQRSAPKASPLPGALLVAGRHSHELQAGKTLDRRNVRHFRPACSGVRADDPDTNFFLDEGQSSPCSKIGIRFRERELEARLPRLQRDRRTRGHATLS